MSHHLLSRKLWIGLLLIPCIFFAIVFAGMDYLEMKLLQIETPVIETEVQTSDQVSNLAVQEAAYQTEKILNNSNIEKTKLEFPCKVQMKHGKIGIYLENESCVKEYKQVGEYLGEVDILELTKGIWVKDETELIVVLESFHLQ